MPNISIQRTSLNTLSQSDLKQQYELLIHAYAETEKEIWGDNYVRVSLEEYKQDIENETVFTAKLDDEVVGTILLASIAEGTFSFSLLAVDFSKKGFGIGRLLIEKAEQTALEYGGKKMSIEILKPKNEAVPFKDQLGQWYQRLGYEFTGSKSFIELKPKKVEKAKELITDAVFDCYEKKLN
jgi:GNAT superfamily N-acetyltransferase